MIGNLIKSIFHKEDWPEDKVIKWVMTTRKGDKPTVIYLTQEQLNIIMELISLGTQVVEMQDIFFTKMEQKSTQGQLMS